MAEKGASVVPPSSVSCHASAGVMVRDCQRARRRAVGGERSARGERGRRALWARWVARWVRWARWARWA
eukprot:153432-Prymnesium_polylepis.1